MNETADTKLDEVDRIWSDDLLNRKADAQFLIDFLRRRVEERGLTGRTSSYVLNLDAKWGDGKTFFLEHLSKQLIHDGYLVANVNAWQDEHADDPLISVMAAINEAVERHLDKGEKLRSTLNTVKKAGVYILITATKHGLIKLAKKGLGEGVEATIDIFENSKQENLDDSIAESNEKDDSAESNFGIDRVLDRYATEVFANFNKAKNSILNFKKNLCNLLQDISDKKKIKIPLFVLIDELDRCRPTYAISLLERLRHIFDIDNVVFLVATDTDQLRHSVRVIYGSQFDSEKYLLRFFDRRYVFEEPSLETFVDRLFSQYAINQDMLSSPPLIEHKKFFEESLRHNSLSLRDAEQCFDLLRTIITLWDRTTKIELVFLLPLIISFHNGDNELFKELENLATARVSDVDEYVNWIIDFPTGDSRLRSHPPSKITMSKLLSLLLTAIKKPLPEASTFEGSAVNEWIGRRMSEEFRVLHGNRYTPGNPPFTVLRSYPELVRNVGRLTPQDE